MTEKSDKDENEKKRVCKRTPKPHDVHTIIAKTKYYIYEVELNSMQIDGFAHKFNEIYMPFLTDCILSTHFISVSFICQSVCITYASMS